MDGLNIQPDGIYVDVTFGGGGHSELFLKDSEREKVASV
ncbi:MAG: 16S rRNA (cytosine(1402)-N(4))-methyltransferase [Bacteroidales bacterium]